MRFSLQNLDTIVGEVNSNGVVTVGAGKGNMSIGTMNGGPDSIMTFGANGNAPGNASEHASKDAPEDASLLNLGTIIGKFTTKGIA